MNRIGELMCATALLASTGAFAQTATLTNDAAPVPVAGISLGAAATAAEQHV